MTRPVLGSLTLMQASFSGFAYPGRAQVVPLLAADPAATGNAVLQSGALGFRQATVSWLADSTADKDTALGYHHALSAQTYTDHDGNDYVVRLIEFSAQLRVGDFWDCTATLLEVV